MGRKAVWLRAILLLVLFVVGFLAGRLLQDIVFEANPGGLAGGSDHPCPLSHGWWKNHPEEWTVDSLRLGARDYGRAVLLELLGIPTREDASVIMVRQLIAAKLNVANGSDPAGAEDSISRADGLLASHPGPLPYGVLPVSPEGSAMVSAAAALEDYNTGRLTPGCEEGPSPAPRGEDAGLGPRALVRP